MLAGARASVRKLNKRYYGNTFKLIEFILCEEKLFFYLNRLSF